MATKKKPAKKKAAPKTKKKAAAKKTPAPKKKAGAKPKKKKKASAVSKLPTDKQIVGGTLLGFVDDYFGHLGVVAVKLELALSVGDMIRVKGHTTDITQKVESMQVDHQPVQTASAGDAVGIKIADKARKGDAIYRI